MNLDVTKLPISPQVRSILAKVGYLDIYNMLTALEMYKFMNREEIIRFLRSEISEGLKGDSLPKLIDVPVESIETGSKELLALEVQYHVIILQQGPAVTIVRSIMDTNEIDGLKLKLAYLTIHEEYVTPYNFEQLKAKRANSKETKNALLLFYRIVYECVSINASDIHFIVQHRGISPSYKICYRLGVGPLFELKLFNLTAEDNASIIREVTGQLTYNIVNDLEAGHGIQTAVYDIFGDGNVNLRLTANKCLDGFHYVQRIITKKTIDMEIKDLGLPLSTQQKLHKLTRKRSGVSFITGAQCTGKSTTMLAISNEMSQYNYKIMELSSPVEVLMPYTQVDYANNLETLENLIRLSKKQDTDILFLNEIPNKSVAFAVQESVNASIHTLTTMHIDRLWHLPYKLYELFGEEYKNLITQINCVINQKMFSLLCPHCQKKVLVNDLNNSTVSSYLIRYGINYVYTASGCEKCRNDEHPELNGTIPGKMQPYVECLFFSDSLKSALLACAKPFEMEMLLRDEMIGEQSSLEFAIMGGLKSGILGVSALDEIL